VRTAAIGNGLAPFQEKVKQEQSFATARRGDPERIVTKISRTQNFDRGETT